MGLSASRVRHPRPDLRGVQEVPAEAIRRGMPELPRFNSVGQGLTKELSDLAIEKFAFAGRLIFCDVSMHCSNLDPFP